ncbi:MAG: hypothetical protein HOW97_15510 [Catenulispora sp.]|nr:hypothetical protein [Catenulispora sp.]
MTTIEEKLTAILTDEADRHDVPAFSAHAIAQSAVAKGFWRRRHVPLIAAIGLAGATGAGGAVVAAAGHDGGGRVTVTFQQDTTGWVHPPPPITVDSAVVRDWVLRRAHAEGLTGIDVTVRQDPFALVVTGRAADATRLRMLGTTTDVLFAEARSVSSETDDHLLAESRCVQKSDIGPDQPLCDRNGHGYTFVISHDGRARAVSAHAVRRGPGVRDWAVAVRFDAAGAEAYRRQAEDRPDQSTADQRITVEAGPFHLGDPVISQPLTDGVFESATGFTRQQAQDLAVDLLDPSPEDGLLLLTATVTPAAHG